MATIRRARPQRLYIAADGPRPGREDDVGACQAAREVALSVDWPCETYTLFRADNLGCRQGVSTAIDWFFEHEAEGIILEDDVVPAPSFFPFCAELLEKYRDDSRISMIGGTNLQKGVRHGNASYYFSRIHHIWGWATWRRAWGKYDRDMRLWEQFKQEDGFGKLAAGSAFKASYSQVFDAVASRQIDTWDYQWFFSGLAQNMVSIIPQVNMVSNVGFGVDATHTLGGPSWLSNMQANDIIFPLVHPKIMLPNADADFITIRNQKRSFRYRLMRVIATSLRRIMPKR